MFRRKEGRIQSFEQLLRLQIFSVRGPGDRSHVPKRIPFKQPRRGLCRCPGTRPARTGRVGRYPGRKILVSPYLKIFRCLNVKQSTFIARFLIVSEEQNAEKIQSKATDKCPKCICRGRSVYRTGRRTDEIFGRAAFGLLRRRGSPCAPVGLRGLSPYAITRMQRVLTQLDYLSEACHHFAIDLLCGTNYPWPEAPPLFAAIPDFKCTEELANKLETQIQHLSAVLATAETWFKSPITLAWTAADLSQAGSAFLDFISADT